MNTYNPEGLCPKCCFSAIKDKFYKNGHHDRCTVSDAGARADIARNMLMVFSRWSSAALAEAYGHACDEAAAVPGHIERVCVRCDYKWAEAPADCT